MKLPSNILNLLKESGLSYELIEHRTVFTAQDKGATLKINPKAIGKTLAVKLGNKYALVVLPANRNLDKNAFKKVVNGYFKKIGEKAVKDLDFTKEQWINKNLKGSKAGAIPPIGRLWKLPTFADRALLQNSKIIINGGAHELSLKLSSSAYRKLLPDLVIGSFSKIRK